MSLVFTPDDTKWLLYDPIAVHARACSLPVLLQRVPVDTAATAVVHDLMVYGRRLSGMGNGFSVVRPMSRGVVPRAVSAEETLHESIDGRNP